MILVDTSVWVRFLANRQPYAGLLDQLLDDELVVGHDLVYGELLIGNRGGRTKLLESYSIIPQLEQVAHSEVIEFARARRLMGLGIGWIDIHLLASCVAAGASIYTADVRLAEVAAKLRVAYS